jgi:hypothetical protein
MGPEALPNVANPAVAPAAPALLVHDVLGKVERMQQELGPTRLSNDSGARQQAATVFRGHKGASLVAYCFASGLRFGLPLSNGSAPTTPSPS